MTDADIGGPGLFSVQARDLTAAVAFLRTPVPCKLLVKRREVALDDLPLPGSGTALWFTEGGPFAYKVLNKAGVPVFKPLFFDGSPGKTFIFVDSRRYRATLYDCDLPALDRGASAR